MEKNKVLEKIVLFFKDNLRKINPKMGLASVSSRHGELADTKYGKSPVCSLSSYQLLHTESNFVVAIDIDSVARHDTHIQEIESFPEGRTGGSLARITNRKNRGSRITDIKISFSRITKISK